MRISLVGPVYPYRGGIAHHTSLLAKHLGARHAVQLISFRRQYPRWMFPGQTDRDPSAVPLQSNASYLLDPFNPLTWWRVAQQVRAWAPDGLILPWWVLFWAPPWLALASLTHRWTNAQVIFLCHNILPHDGVRAGRTVARHVLAQGDSVIAQSLTDLRMLQELLPGKRTVWTPHPTYTELGRGPGGGARSGDRQAARARLNLAAAPPGTPILLFFGFVRPYKGLSVLLEAMPIIRARTPAHLLVVGEIWGSPKEYEAQINRLGIADHVTLVNQYVPNERLGDYFDAADVVILPYVSATQSGVVQLAFGYGVPVIASRVGSLVETVRDGETGLLVPPNDPVALAEAVIRFLCEGLGPALRAHITSDQARFSWQHMVETVEHLLGGQG